MNNKFLAILVVFVQSYLSIGVAFAAISNEVPASYTMPWNEKIEALKVPEHVWNYQIINPTMIKDRWSLFSELAGKSFKSTVNGKTLYMSFDWVKEGWELHQNIFSPNEPDVVETYIWKAIPYPDNGFVSGWYTFKGDSRNREGRVFSDNTFTVMRKAGFIPKYAKESEMYFPYKNGFAIAKGTLGTSASNPSEITTEAINNAQIWVPEKFDSTTEEAPLAIEKKSKPTPNIALPIQEEKQTSFETEQEQPVAEQKLETADSYSKKYPVLKLNRSVKSKITLDAQKLPKSSIILVDGQAGKTVSFKVSTVKFNPMISVYKLENNSKVDSATGKSPLKLDVTLPDDGVYMVIVTASDKNKAGEFTIEAKPSAMPVEDCCPAKIEKTGKAPSESNVDNKSSSSPLRFFLTKGLNVAIDGANGTCISNIVSIPAPKRFDDPKARMSDLKYSDGSTAREKVESYYNQFETKCRQQVGPISNGPPSFVWNVKDTHHDVDGEHNNYKNVRRGTRVVEITP